MLYTSTKATKKNERKWRRMQKKSYAIKTSTTLTHTHTQRRDDADESKKKCEKTTSTASLIHQVSPSISAGGFSFFSSSYSFKEWKNILILPLSPFVDWILCRSFALPCFAGLYMFFVILLFVVVHLKVFFSFTLSWFTCTRSHLSHNAFFTYCHPMVQVLFNL